MSLRPFEHIVNAYGPMVLRVCRAVVGPAHAEDAWSETFLAALRAYPDLDPGANVEAWLVTIARRKAIDHWRAESRAPVGIDALPEQTTSSVVDGHSEPWEVDLLDAVRALPPKQREAVAFHYLGGLPYAEVGAILGNSEDAARRAAADGIKALRAKLGAADGTDEKGERQ